MMRVDSRTWDSGIMISSSWTEERRVMPFFSSSSIFVRIPREQLQFTAKVKKMLPRSDKFCVACCNIYVFFLMQGSADPSTVHSQLLLLNPFSRLGRVSFTFHLLAPPPSKSCFLDVWFLSLE